MSSRTTVSVVQPPLTKPNLLHPLPSSNSFVKYMVNGTQINEALDIGKRKNGQDCGEVYKDCKLDKDMVLQMFKKLM